MFIGEDVEAELPRALARVARDTGVALADAERALARIVPRMRVVPLRMGDYLNPRIAGLRRYDPDLKDSVFNRFGVAPPAGQWTEGAGRLLVAAGDDATFAEAADAAETLARLLFGGITAATKAAARITSVAFSPDGETLATAESSDTGSAVLLWDVATGRQIGSPLYGAMESVAFSPDGKTLVTSSGSGTAQLWNVTYLVDVLARLCSQVGGFLSRAEWSQYVPPAVTYRKVCP